LKRRWRKQLRSARRRNASGGVYVAINGFVG
jgi:hypothetical protein